MVPEMLDPAVFLRNISPKQYGPYRIDVDPESEMSLFHELSRHVSPAGVFHIHIMDAVIDLDYWTAIALQDPMSEVKVGFFCVINGYPEVQEFTVMTPSYFIVGLQPIKP